MVGQASGQGHWQLRIHLSKPPICVSNTQSRAMAMAQAQLAGWRPHALPGRAGTQSHRIRVPRLHAKPEGAADEQQPSKSVAEVAEQLMRDPANAARLQRVSDAAQRVAELQAESERLAGEMAAAAAAEAASAEERERRSTEAAAALMAEAEVAAAAKLLQAAQLQAEAADAARFKWASDINEVRAAALAGPSSLLLDQEQSGVLGGGL